MKQRDRSYWSLLPFPLWIAYFACALILAVVFCWLATVYHWYGVTAASSRWSQYVALGPMSFVFALMAMGGLATGLKKARLEAVPWYMQGYVVRGIVGIALCVLLVLNGINSVSGSIIAAVGQGVQRIVRRIGTRRILRLPRVERGK